MGSSFDRGPGLPVGGFAAAGTEMPAPEKTTPSNDKSAQRFSDGLRGGLVLARKRPYTAIQLPGSQGIQKEIGIWESSERSLY